MTSSYKHNAHLGTHPLFCEQHTHTRNVNYSPLLQDSSGETLPTTIPLHPSEITLVFYHFPCWDGFTSAMTAYMYNPNIKFRPVNHTALNAIDPNDLKGEKILFVDICPRLDVFKTWNLPNYLVLDHHKTTFHQFNPEHKGDFKDVYTTLDHRVYLHPLKSGVGLAWMYFFPGTCIPYMFQCVQARDIWKFHMAVNSKVYMTGFAKLFVNCVECLQRIDDNTVLDVGRREQAIRNTLIETERAKAQVTGKIIHLECEDYTLRSDLGAALVKYNRNSIACLWKHSPPEIWVSLRSHDPDGPDVSSLAGKFQGGGHKHAAGFSVLVSQKNWLDTLCSYVNKPIS